MKGVYEVMTKDCKQIHVAVYLEILLKTTVWLTEEDHYDTITMITHIPVADVFFILIFSLKCRIIIIKQLNPFST